MILRTVYEFFSTTRIYKARGESCMSEVYHFSLLESVAELRVPMFQAVLTVPDIDADSAIGTCASIITDDRSSCWFSDDNEVSE